MSLPKPQEGLVIRYNYLFFEDAEKGLEEAPYDRPCMILRVLPLDVPGGGLRIYILPITHTAPKPGTAGILLPVKTSRRLGMDDDQSWLILDDVNDFIWPGPDVRITPQYGMMPPGLYAKARDQFVKLARARKADVTRRTDV